MASHNFAAQVAHRDTPLMANDPPLQDVSDWVRLAPGQCSLPPSAEPKTPGLGTPPLAYWVGCRLQWRQLEKKSKEKGAKDEKGKSKPDWTEIRMKSTLKILAETEEHHTGAAYGTTDVAHLAQVEIEQGKMLDRLTEENKQLKEESKQLKAGSFAKGQRGGVPCASAHHSSSADLARCLADLAEEKLSVSEVKDPGPCPQCSEHVTKIAKLNDELQHALERAASAASVAVKPGGIGTLTYVLLALIILMLGAPSPSKATLACDDCMPMPPSV